jgi:hypothetical protein
MEKERSLVSKSSNSLNDMIKRSSVSAKQRRKLSGNELLMTITVSLVIIGAIFGLVAVGYEMTAFAAKPQTVIDKSNGFPSGAHYNLHISGKGLSFDPDPSTCNTHGGNTIFTPLNSTEDANLMDNQTISMYVNKKTGLDHLVVRDHCTEEFDGSAGQLQLPDEFENGTKITQGMYVFARVLGGPDKGSNDKDSNIILIPNPNVEACNLDDEDPDSGSADDCFDTNGNKQEFVELGFVTKKGAYVGDLDKDGTKLYRYTTDDGETPAKGQGKGAKKAVDITGLFMWFGIACEDGLVQDGQLTIADFDDVVINGIIEPGEGGGLITLAHIDAAEALVIAAAGDFVDNGVIDTDEEFEALIVILAAAGDFPGCVEVEPTWVFNILDADLVIQNHTLVNDGVSNLQIRFYPVETTLFTPVE